MKPVREPVEVRTRHNRPLLVRRGRQVYDVRSVLDYWVIQGNWWAEEERRLYFRLNTSGGVLDVYRRGEEWVLERLLD